MGNSYLCGSKPCVQPRPVYKTILNNLFKINSEKKAEENSSSSQLNKNEEPNKESAKNIKSEAVLLEAHVKSQIKSLVDYLETNHNKVAECGEHIFHRMQSSVHIEIHLVGLMIFTELLNESKKFTHDKTFLSRLALQKKDTLTKQDINEKEKDTENNSFMDAITDGIIEFETYSIEAITFIFSTKKYKSNLVILKYVLQTLLAYSKSHAGTIPNDKIENILNDILESIAECKDLNSAENLELHSILLEIMTVLTLSPSLVFKFKHKFIDYSFNLLKRLYESRRFKLYNTQGNEKFTSEDKKLTEKIISSSLDLFVDVCQTVYDLSELNILISPVLVLLDSTKWAQEKLHTDLILSLTRSRKSSSIVEHIEIFIIKKIIQYLDYKKDNNTLQLQSFKNNEDLDVIIRVFLLLEKIFHEINTPMFLFMINEVSFFDVNNIKMICTCIINKLELINRIQSSREVLLSVIYKCFKSYVEKMSILPKNSLQILHCIIMDIFNKSLKPNRDNKLIGECYNLLFFTFDCIGVLPSDQPLSKDSIVILFKLSENNEFQLQANSAIEKFIDMTYALDPEDRNSKCEFITLQPNLIYVLLKNNLSKIKKSLEKTSNKSEEGELELFNLLKIFSKIGSKILMRKDIKCMKILLPFFKKIMDIIEAEDSKNSSKYLLTIFVLTFLEQINLSWKIEGFGSKLEGLKQTLPSGTFNLFNFDANKEKEEIFNILASFLKINYISSIKRHIEYENYMNLILAYAKKTEPYHNFSEATEDFEELELVFLSTPGMTEEPPSFHETNNRSNIEQSGSLIRFFEPNSSPIEKKLMKKDSMGPFDQYQHILQENSRLENSNQVINSIPILVDDSFEKAMNELKNTKPKNSNLIKIIETKI